MFVGFCSDVDGISHSMPFTAQEDHCFLDTVGPRRNRNCLMAAFRLDGIYVEGHLIQSVVTFQSCYSISEANVCRYSLSETVISNPTTYFQFYCCHSLTIRLFILRYCFRQFSFLNIQLREAFLFKGELLLLPYEKICW